MQLFDFHHHHRQTRFGIYNPMLNESPPPGFFSRGLHPMDISDEWRTVFERMKEESLQNNCIALGECGLDRLIPIPMALQETVFREHILWANDIKKPLIIHCVKSFAELLPFRKKSEVAMIVHGFHKKRQTAEMLLAHGFHLSFGKAVLASVSLQEIIKNIPAERFFLETDDSEVKIEEIYTKVAEIRQTTVEKLHQQILENLENSIRK